jgi:UDP-N-acetylmuramoyl-tripeptide--D-alanyl-D-alanine ligase
MGELADPDVDHRTVTADAVERGVEVVAVGTDRYGVDPVADASDPAAVVEAIGPLGEGDVVLVKASRAAGLECVARALLDR